jgi:hypothetical protein
VTAGAATGQKDGQSLLDRSEDSDSYTDRTSEADSLRDGADEPEKEAIRINSQVSRKGG